MNDQEQPTSQPPPQNRSADINELASALAKAQGQLFAATKDAKNPFVGNNYADLASVWASCREPLSVNGLSVVQMPGGIGTERYVDTLLLHSSGQWIASRLKMTAGYIPKGGKFTPSDDPQSIGSSITYARRYALMAIVGVAAEDDDGEDATRGLRPFTESASASPSHDLEAMQSILKQHEENAMAALRKGDEREAKRLQGLAADMRIVIQEAWDKEKPQPKGISAQEAKKEQQAMIERFEKSKEDDVPMTHATDSVKTVEAKVDQVEPPKKEPKKVAEKPVEPAPTEKKAAEGSNDPIAHDLSRWAEYKLQMVPAAAYKGKALGSFAETEIAVLYKKRSLPFLNSEEPALKLEAQMIQQAHDSK